MTMKNRIILSFLLVVGIFFAAAVYQFSVMSKLGEYQDAGAGRFRGAIEVKEISHRASDIYVIAADAAINRNLEESRRSLEQATQQMAKDMERLNALVDTKEEKDRAAETARVYRDYVTMVSGEYLSAVASLGEHAKGSNEEKLQHLDGKVDSQRTKLMEEMELLVQSLNKEAEE
ncbi:MAG TPA: hypothetical protein HPQ00_13070, partial [Magnetococcales bacterium]|nr:hypothetical protein [Magnetococcales bacterium]